MLIWIALRTKVFHPALLTLLPFAAFVSTTPQAIGFLWILALVIAIKNNVPKPYLWLFAIAALAAHPLAGVPATILVLLVSLNRHAGLDPACLAGRQASSVSRTMDHVVRERCDGSRVPACRQAGSPG
jgi:hypothetical protein